MSACRRCSCTARRFPPERLRHADALAEILDDLPDELTRHTSDFLFTAVPLYWAWNSGSLAAAPDRSFARYSLTIAHATSGSGTVVSWPPLPSTRRSPNCGW